MADQGVSEFGIGIQDESDQNFAIQEPFPWGKLSKEDNQEIDKLIAQGTLTDRSDPIVTRCELASERFYPDFGENVDFDGMNDLELESFAEEHMDDILALAHGLVHKPIQDRCWYVLKDLSEGLLCYVDPEISKKPIQTIYHYLSQLGDKPLYDEPGEPRGTIGLWLELAKYSDLPDVSPAASKWLEHVLEDPEHSSNVVYNVVGSYMPTYYDDSSEHTIFYERMMKQYLSSLDIPADELFTWWKDAGSLAKRRNSESSQYDVNVVNSVFSGNIRTIIDIEKARKGSVKELFEEFNIHNFGRYSEDTLLNQLDRKNHPGKSVLVFQAKHDHNKAFFGSHRWMSLFKSDLQAIDPDINMRIYEVDSRTSIVRAHKKEARKFGPNIIGEIYSAHGEADHFTLSTDPVRPTSPSEVVSAEDLPPFIVERMKDKYFNPDAKPFIILDSCSTDQELGPHIRSNSTALVLAPDKPVALDAIRAIITTDGEMEIRAEWTAGNKAIEKVGVIINPGGW